MISAPWAKLLHSVGIVIGCTILACVYGILHDQITIRICPEYFTVWHPHLFETRYLGELAFYWGVYASWWMGFALGGLLAIANAAGALPSFPVRSVLARVIVLLLLVGVLAALAGWITRFTGFTLPDVMGPRIWAMGLAKQRAFTADLVAHNVSYDVSTLGAIGLAIWIWFTRRSRAQSGEGTFLPKKVGRVR